jgi:tripartite-type tricarboxylate transporter receptor subunit TctC
MNVKPIFNTIATAFALICAPFVLAQTAAPAGSWPAKSITIIVPYSAGGSLDGTTRLVAQHLSARLGQSVVIDNATGAGGAVGIAKAIAANPDGYTLLMAGDSPFRTDVSVADIKAGTSPYKYDMPKELIPTVLVNTAPMLLVAHPSVAANNLPELVALAKQQPGRLNYASSGIGTIPHLATEMIKAQTQTHMVHIPYRGGTQIANDVAGKQVDLAMMISASALPHIQSKVIKPIAVTGDTRLAALPNVPTVAETTGFQGLKSYNVVSWAGLYAPAKTPAAIVQRLAAEVSEVLKMDVVKTRLQDQAALARGGTPAQFASFIEHDRSQLTKVLQTTSLKE